MHFGASDRLVYGVFHPAASPRLRRGAVLLNPYGWEALRAHRTLRTLALRLARAGIDTLRFDYSCTGDSLGDGGDASWAHWIEDADYALDEIQALAGLRKASLVGLRMGALVAAELSARRPDAVDRQVLWAPPATGGDVVGWARSGHPDEVAAFPVGPRLEDELDSVRPGSLTTPGVPALVLTSEADEVPSRLFADAEQAWLPTDEPPCWVEDRDFGAGAVPVPLLDRITEWLAA
jgi:pimeloyl-ACP methyl ester carboxylesterase